MKSWYDIYCERMNDRYFAHIKSKYGPFILAINSNIAHFYVELGCGAGNITKALHELRPDAGFIMYDNCSQMLSLAIKNNPSYATPLLQDITLVNNEHFQQLGSAAVHSHGVLEHFSDRDINKIISANAKCPQVHYVPSDEYSKPSRGDERLMSLSQWNKILKQNKDINFDLSSFNYGLDIIIRTWEKL